MSEWMNYSYN